VHKLEKGGGTRHTGKDKVVRRPVVRGDELGIKIRILSLPLLSTNNTETINSSIRLATN
jgi:hypothetical protein